MPGTAHRPVLIIGLDGATFELLDPLMELGDLPTLAGVAAHGTRAVLRSVVPPITPAAWASFMTGKSPGAHGIYDFRVFDPRTHTDTFVTSHALRDATIWELATAAGRRVGSVGLPLMYPPNPHAGTVVAGFDAPSTRTQFTSPAALRDRILELVPDYEFSAVSAIRDPSLRSEGATDEFLQAVERSFEQRTIVALDLLRNGRWDLFMLHHQDIDALQHRAWRYVAERRDEAVRWEQLRRLYRRLDGLLADVLAAVPEDTLVLILSDHGFGTHTGRIYPNRVLADLGYLRRARRSPAQRVLRSLRKRLARLGLPPAPPAATPDDPKTWMAKARERSFTALLSLDWQRTRAYVAVAEIYGLLFLNLRGREPRGVVRPGSAADGLLDEIRGRLLAQRTPGDGAPLFADVLRGDSVYPADGSGRRPDLVLVPRPGFSMTRDLAPQGVELYEQATGTHRPEGILLVSGPGTRRGSLPEGADMVDVAPTVLAALGLPVPTDMEGQVLARCFLDPPAVERTAPTPRAGDDARDLTDAEADEVTRRLQALGYMT